MKARFIDKSYTSLDGNDEYMLFFREKSSLTAGDEAEMHAKLETREIGVCDVSYNDLRAFNINALNIIRIIYRDKYQKWVVTEMKVSWAGRTEILSTKYLI